MAAQRKLAEQLEEARAMDATKAKMLAHYQGGEQNQREVIAQRAIQRMANAGILR
jgi:hypothetical protein